MNDVAVKVSWESGLKFKGTTARGHETILDGHTTEGGSPVEILLEALGACAAVDVVVILEKVRTPATRLEVTVEGNRRDETPRYFTDATMRFDVWGEQINTEKLARAINLSIGKYCSVYHSLRPDLKLLTQYRIHATGAEPTGEYRVVEMSAPTGELQ